MKYALLPVLICLALSASLAQKSQTTKKPVVAKTTAAKPHAAPNKAAASKSKSPGTKTKPAVSKTTASKTTASKAPAAPKKTIDEKAEYQKAISMEDPAEKIAALSKFIEAFPASPNKGAAQELLAATRIQLADEKLKAGDADGGIALLRVAVAEMPGPIPEKLYTDEIGKIPAELYRNGQRDTALEIATTIEGKISGNASQFLDLASFYLGVESGSDAKRLAEKALAIDAASTAGLQTLGLAYRLNFQLEEAAQTYAKVLELNPESPQTLRSLADLNRALGKPDEAAALYRRIIEKDPASIPAQTGLIMSMFDAGKRADAESEMAKSLEQNPNNIILLAGAAYWYAGHGDGDKAIDLGQRAVANEPRYIWSHIALARGYMAKHQPVDAEQALLKARQYGNFPTLEYELASARLMSGFYRDAADELRKSFTVKDGVIHVRLGGRVDREDGSFTDLLSGERRASIFEPSAADDAENASRLKALLVFDQEMNTPEPNEERLAQAADAFAGGDDRMKVHRELYAASGLLNKRVALGKVLELAKAAVGNTDAALDVPNAGAAVMASELYDSRALALARQEFLRVPDVPHVTLSAILRGRIEEIIGWALYNQGKAPEAVIRLRRAVSVMPEKSAWWRSSMWKLGAALQADGKDAEALDSYVKSYSTDKPDAARYMVVESLYRKVNGNADGLEAKIGVNPLPVVPVQKAEPTPETVAQTASPEPTPTPDPNAAVKKEDVGPAKPEPSATETGNRPEIKVEATPAPSPEITPEPTPQSTPSPAATPEIKSIESKAEPTPTPAEPAPSPTPLDQTVAKAQNGSPAESTVSKPLFDPVIITIPKTDPSKPIDESKKSMPPTDTSVPAADEKKTVPEPQKEDKDEPKRSGEVRARVVEGKEIKTVDIPRCTISVSQESISILNSGGSLGILVGIDGGDLKSMKSSSTSPGDVQVTLEPEIAGVSGRAFYVIKSISSNTGLFQIVFESPCGRKEVSVKVR